MDDQPQPAPKPGPPKDAYRIPTRSAAQAAMRRFREEPESIRWAMVILIIGIVAAVGVASGAVWILDSADYPTPASALWFTLQTVTTVGYGDDVPTTLGGRLVGGAVMVVGIAFVSVLTALITSALVDSANERRHRYQVAHQEAVIRRLTEQFDEMNERITRIETAVTGSALPPRPGPPGHEGLAAADEIDPD